MNFSDKVKNMVRNRENVGFENFPPFPQMCSKAIYPRVVESRNNLVKD